MYPEDDDFVVPSEKLNGEHRIILADNLIIVLAVITLALGLAGAPIRIGLVEISTAAALGRLLWLVGRLCSASTHLYQSRLKGGVVAKVEGIRRIMLAGQLIILIGVTVGALGYFVFGLLSSGAAISLVALGGLLWLAGWTELEFFIAARFANLDVPTSVPIHPPQEPDLQQRQPFLIALAKAGFHFLCSR